MTVDQCYLHMCCIPIQNPIVLITETKLLPNSTRGIYQHSNKRLLLLVLLLSPVRVPVPVDHLALLLLMVRIIPQATAHPGSPALVSVHLPPPPLHPRLLQKMGIRVKRANDGPSRRTLSRPVDHNRLFRPAYLKVSTIHHLLIFIQAMKFHTHARQVVACLVPHPMNHVVPIHRSAYPLIQHLNITHGPCPTIAVILLGHILWPIVNRPQLVVLLAPLVESLVSPPPSG